MKVALLLVAVLCVAAALEIAVDSNSNSNSDKPRKTRKPRKGAKLVPVSVYQGHWIPKKSIIIVPKGDPRAYAPGKSRVAGLPARPTLQASSGTGCTAIGGTCKAANTCSSGRTQSGLCPGDASIKCCLPTVVQPPQPPQPPTAGCGAYGAMTGVTKTGNGGKAYTVYPILAADLTDPSKVGQPDNLADNTIMRTTACAWASMKAAATAAGVNLRISSGFRTYARQLYFWNCYKKGNCNNGNLAAKPGSSNHGTGIALDLNTDCGGQTTSRAPAACKSSKVYMWLLANARRFGFIRAVLKEPWHWEHHPGSAPPSYQNF